MTTSQLHDKARALALRLGITHSQACSVLARRGRGKAHGGNYGRTTVAPLSQTTNSNVEKPAARYWWQDNS